MVKKYSDKQKAKVRILRKKGYTYERIEKKTKVKASSLFYIINNDRKGYDNFQETIINKLNFEPLIQNSQGKNETQIKRVLKKQIKSLAEENNHLVPETKQSSKKRRIIEQIVNTALNIFTLKSMLSVEVKDKNLFFIDQIQEDEIYFEDQVSYSIQEEYSEDFYSSNNQVQQEIMEEVQNEQSLIIQNSFDQLNLGQEEQFQEFEIQENFSRIEEIDQESLIFLPEPKSQTTQTQDDDPSRE